MKTAQEYQLDDIPLAMLASQAGHHYSFYNLSRHNLKTITNDPDTLALNLRDYINRFSENVRDILEELIRKFAEASNETAGENFTPREVIELMVTLLLSDGEDLPTDQTPSI